MNIKHEKSYELVFKSLLNIITIENTVKLNLISVTTDFEKSLTNAVKKVFNNIRHIGCLFHFVKNIRLNLLKIGLINNEIIHITDEFLKDLSSTPFRINDNPIIIEDIFEKYEKFYNNTDYYKQYTKFKKYFYDTWLYYYNIGSLNYIYINKIQRSNSYLENYNRRIKDILRPFLTKRGKSIIPWPLLLALIRNEEKHFRKIITNKLTEEPKKIEKFEFPSFEFEMEENLKDFSTVKTNLTPKWLNYKSFSCRYDSFLFLFFTTINKI